jgi:hypothetical protein
MQHYNEKHPDNLDQQLLARNGFERGGLNISHLLAQRVCFAIADLFTHSTRSILIKAPLKEQDTQEEKVKKPDADGGYDGEWSKIKDIVRTTILTKDPTTFKKVVDSFQICQNKWALNEEIKRIYSLPFYKDHLYRDLTEVERRMILSGAWEIMPGAFKQKKGEIDGYTDASVVLQYSTRNSVGGANQPKTPTRAAVGPSQALWVQTVRVEIQINVPDMIYGKQFEKDFLKMISPPHGERLFSEIKKKTSIFAGLGHLFYEVARQKVLVAETQKLSKRYYEYIRQPKPGSPEFISLCQDIAAYINDNRAKIKEIAGEKHHLPGELAPKELALKNTLLEIGCGHPCLTMPSQSPPQSPKPGPQPKKWAPVQIKPGYRS